MYTLKIKTYYQVKYNDYIIDKIEYYYKTRSFWNKHKLCTILLKKIGLLDVNKLDYAISMIIRKSIIVNHKNKNIYLSNGISHKPNFILYIDKPVYFNKTYEIVKLVRYN